MLSRSVRVAGDELDEAIIQYMKRAYNLMIGERMAEDIKVKIGSAYPLEQELTMEVKGRDLVAGLPKTLTVTSEEVREALQEPISTIVENVRVTLSAALPNWQPIRRPRHHAGGRRALIGASTSCLPRKRWLPVHISDDPLSAVALGTGVVLQELGYLEELAKNSS